MRNTQHCKQALDMAPRLLERLTLIPTPTHPTHMAAKKTTKKKAPAKKAAKKATKKVAKKAVKTAAKKAPKKAPKKAAKKALSFDEIAAEAYYIYRDRSAKGLPGNPESDWLAAEKKLRS